MQASKQTWAQSKKKEVSCPCFCLPFYRWGERRTLWHEWHDNGGDYRQTTMKLSSGRASWDMVSFCVSELYVNDVTLWPLTVISLGLDDTPYTLMVSTFGVLAVMKPCFKFPWKENAPAKGRRNYVGKSWEWLVRGDNGSISKEFEPMSRVS